MRNYNSQFYNQDCKRRRQHHYTYKQDNNLTQSSLEILKQLITCELLRVKLFSALCGRMVLSPAWKTYM